MMPSTPQAFLFDLNGTIIDDMRYHVKAWHRVFTDLGVKISYEETKAECYGKNEEVIERVMPGRFSDKEKTEMGYAKEKQYQQEFRPYLQLIPGLDLFFEQAKQAGIKMAIGSAAVMYNVDFVLDGLNIRHYFDAIVSADDVHFSKPHPETFLQGAGKLNVPAGNCIVFEDAPKGVEAAINAGMKSVVITTMHGAEEFAGYNDHILLFGKDFHEISLEKIFLA